MNDLVEGVKIEGKVELDGKNIFKDMDAITLRHKVGMVFQQPNPFPKRHLRQCGLRPENLRNHKKQISMRSLREATAGDLG